MPVVKAPCKVQEHLAKGGGAKGRLQDHSAGLPDGAFRLVSSHEKG